MWLSILRTMALAMVAVLVSLLAFEGILAITLPTVETASPAKTPIVNNSPTTIPPPAPPELRSSEPGGLAQQATCHSDYYAVFSTEHGPVCAKNPTSLMPHWGPPSQGWFWRSDGQFQLARDDALAPAAQCACLVHQPAYQRPAHGLTGEPVDTLVYDRKAAKIQKWVCADACDQSIREVANTKGGGQVFKRASRVMCDSARSPGGTK
jgi:hypothetical protein